MAGVSSVAVGVVDSPGDAALGGCVQQDTHRSTVRVGRLGAAAEEAGVLAAGNHVLIVVKGGASGLYAGQVQGHGTGADPAPHGCPGVLAVGAPVGWCRAGGARITSVPQHASTSYGSGDVVEGALVGLVDLGGASWCLECSMQAG